MKKTTAENLPELVPSNNWNINFGTQI